MKREDAIRELQRRESAIRQLGARSLYLFGSTARESARAGSDLDLFIDYDRNSRFNALDLVGIKLYLEAELHTEVDLTTRNGLHPALRERIEAGALRIF